jgi:hypothetical protein
MKTFGPPEFDDGLKAALIIAKMLLPVPKTRDFGLHNGSPSYPNKIQIG